MAGESLSANPYLVTYSLTPSFGQPTRPPVNHQSAANVLYTGQSNRGSDPTSTPHQRANLSEFISALEWRYQQSHRYNLTFND